MKTIFVILSCGIAVLIFGESLWSESVSQPNSDVLDLTMLANAFERSAAVARAQNVELSALDRITVRSVRCPNIPSQDCFAFEFPVKRPPRSLASQTEKVIIDPRTSYTKVEP